MRTRISLGLLALGLGLAGCGGEGPTKGGSATAPAPIETTAGTTPATTPGGKAKTPKPAKPKRLPPTDPAKGCDAQGINVTQLREGACTEGGVRYVVVNSRSALGLDSVRVAVAGISFSEHIVGGGREALPRNGAFVIVTLRVENRSEVARTFGPGQTFLAVGDQHFLERADVERRIHERALARGGVKLRPGETVQGDVVFDVPPDVIQRLSAEGRLFVGNFGDRPGVDEEPAQIGQVRLYA